MPKNYYHKKDFRLWKKSETFYFLNGIIDYGSLCIDYESLLKTVGQLLLIRSIYRIRNHSRHWKALDVLRIQKRRGNQNSDWTEFWWEFMKNSPDSKIVEKLSQKTFWFSQKKKVMDWPCSKHGGYFVPIPWRALCGQEIFSMRIEVFFYSNRNIFSTALIKEARIHDYRNQRTPV